MKNIEIEFMLKIFLSKNLKNDDKSVKCFLGFNTDLDLDRNIHENVNNNLEIKIVL